MITATIQVETRPTSSSAISTPDTSSLSAVVSRKEPSLLVTPQRRARRPSTQSVAAATQNSAAAINSDDSSSPFSTSHITTGVRRIRVALPAAIKPAERMLLRITIGFATRRADSTARCPRRCLPGALGEGPEGGRRGALRVALAQRGLDGRDPARRHAQLADAEPGEHHGGVGLAGQLAAHSHPAPVRVERPR